MSLFGAKKCRSTAFVIEERVVEFDPMGMSTYNKAMVAHCDRPEGHSLPHYHESYSVVHKWDDANAIKP